MFPINFCIVLMIIAANRVQSIAPGTSDALLPDLTCFVTPPVRDPKSVKPIKLLAVRGEAAMDVVMTFSSHDSGQIYSDGNIVEFGQVTGVRNSADSFDVIVQSASLFKPGEEHQEPARFGVHYCDQFLIGGTQSFRAPLLIHNQRDLIPADGIRAHVFSVGDTLELCVDPTLPKTWKGPIEWAFNGRQPSWLKRFSGSLCISIKHVPTSQAGIYEAYRRVCGLREKRHAYFDVRVRSCPDGFYGPPGCTTACSVTCVHGYCSADDGTCVCSNGFKGASCDTAIKGSFGNILDVTFSSVGLDEEGKGSLICTERSGCSCTSGWKGIDCNEACDALSYGPDCAYACPEGNPCDSFTGQIEE